MKHDLVCPGTRLLLIEDDVKAAEFLVEGLEDCGYSTEHASDGRSGLTNALRGRFDLIIADRMLPEMDGLQIVKTLRERGFEVPVLVLSALGTVDDRVQGLRSGGDDYLTKPFAFPELLARIGALLRRKVAVTNAAATDATRLNLADLELDLLSRRVTRAGREIELTAREFRLLEFLVRRAGQVVTRTMLLETVWDLHFDPRTSVIDVHISRLRQAIDKNFHKALIQTVRGVGYTMRDDDASS
jgi:two-component system OmpR family response regulator